MPLGPVARTGVQKILPLGENRRGDPPGAGAATPASLPQPPYRRTLRAKYHDLMPSFLSPDPAVERRIRELGEKLFAAMDACPAPGIFSKKGAYARVMEWSMKDPAFKTQLFRFVDVLPALKSSGEIVRHLQEYLGDQAVELNPAMKVGLAASSFAPALIAGPVKANVVSMAAQFVAGETPDDLIK